MRWPSILVVALGWVGLGSAAPAEVVDFEKDRAGELPAGFTVAQTGPGEAPRWRVEEDPSANVLEGNVVLYKVERGKRSDLDPIGSGLFAYGKQAPVRAGAWQELRVHVKGDLFQVHLDGAHLFDVRDATFAGAGRVGLWTKADSVTAFDDLAIEALDAHGEGS